jgi:uncharacterized membrane protein HdeD (DUF308 family)
MATRPVTTTITAPFALRWSSVAFRSAISIVFGLVAIMWPGPTLLALTLLFGVYAFSDGVVALVVAVQGGEHPHRWLLVLDGIVGVGAALVTVLWPRITLLALIFLVGARFAISGLLEIIAALRLRDELRSPVLYALAGIASLLFGLLMFAVPGLSALVLLVMLAVFSLAFGVVLLVLAARLRRLQATPLPPRPAAAHA